MVHTNLRGNRPAGSGEKFFKRFLPYNNYGHGRHLGHVTSIMSSDFYFLETESLHKKFGSDRQSSF